jgi:hypothetical protein
LLVAPCLEVSRPSGRWVVRVLSRIPSLLGSGV